MTSLSRKWHMIAQCYNGVYMMFQNTTAKEEKDEDSSRSVYC